MEFRRSGQRDDRRRRVLREEVMRESTPRASRDTGPLARDYSRAARRVSQPRIVDSIPKRVWHVWLLALLLIGAGLGCSYLEYYLAPLAKTSPLAAHFLPSAPGGVDQWLATCLLLIGAFVAYQIWSMRRYKSNDYRGAYQVWLWMAAGLLLASLEVNAHLSVFLDHYLASEFGWTRPTRYVTWSHVLMVGCGMILLARLMLEQRRSQSALLTMLLAAGCFVGQFAYADMQSLVEEFVVEPASSEASMQAPRLGLALCSQALLVVSLWCYARFVFLEAHGLLKRVEQRRSQRTVRRRARHIRLLRAKREKREALAAEAAAEAARNAQPADEDGQEDQGDDRAATKRRRRKQSAEVPRSKLEDRPALKVAAESSESDEAAGDQRSRKKKTRKSSTVSPAARQHSEPEEQEAAENLEAPALGIAPGTQADDGSSPGRSSGMSKAERRRLRKQSRRSERRAA